MMKQAFGAALCIVGLLIAGSAPVSQASDWVDDFRDPPRPAPDRQAVAPSREVADPMHVAQGGYLTGSASMVGTGGIPQTRLVPQNSMPSRQMMQGYANDRAETDRLMMQARTDTVVPPTSLAGWLQRTHPEFNLNAQSNPDAIVQVKGAWDNSSQILKAMGIRYHEIKAKELREFPLNNTRVMVINCEGKVPADAVENVRQWVINGGYLISTDWTLGTFLERAFPGVIAFDGYHCKGTTVDAVLTNADPELLAGTQVTRATWKLDEESQAVRILKPGSVRVLARSYRLADMDPNSSRTADPGQRGVLACEFNYGRGAVLHLVGHFDYNAPVSAFLRYMLPDAIPGAGIGLRQAIATNFLMRGLQQADRPRRAPTL